MAAADVCIIGMGAVGSIIAKELTKAGLDVVGLERGPALERKDYAPRDSIRYIVRHKDQVYARHDPIMVRTGRDAAARLRYTSTPLNALGGATLHWTGQAARFMPGDFKVHTNEIASGAAGLASADLSGYDIRDWPIGFDDLEPYYERFEWEFGVSGVAGTNPFAGPRKRPYPLPPLRHSAKMELFAEACKRLGYHPYDTAAGILSQTYRPPAPFDTRIPERPGCVYCGHCNQYGCHVHARGAALYTTLQAAMASPRLDLRTNCRVYRINTDDRSVVTGVSYYDAGGASHTQNARVVVLGGFVFENARLLLLSQGDTCPNGLGNSQGQVGKYVMAHGDVRVCGLFDDFIINGFIGPGSAAMRIDDFNGNNFDHTGLGFIRGGTMGTSGGGTPVERMDVVPPGTPRWGAAYKEYFSRYYTRSFDINIQPETLPHGDNVVELDPDQRDRWGIRLPRVTFSLHQNEARMRAFLARIGEGIMGETGAAKIWSVVKPSASRWAGGTRMGEDPSSSVVNAQCQLHEAPNLFVLGSSVFPTMAGYPPLATISALAYRAAEYIQQQRDWFR
jgi:gluconate 2-dehydrogenase alpha chain